VGEVQVLASAAAWRRWRRAAAAWSLFPLDAAVWVGAVVLAVGARYDFDLVRFPAPRAALFGLVAASLHALAGRLVGIYLHRFVPASFDEAFGVAVTDALTGGILFCSLLVARLPALPRSSPLIATALAIVGMLGVRFVTRRVTLARTRAPSDATRVVVFGAGSAGGQLVRQMRTDRDQCFIPTALLDDDQAKRRLRIDGVRVQGTREDLAGVAERTGATAVVIAMPSADAGLVRDLSRRASVAGLRVLILPTLEQLMRRQVAPGDLRDVDVYDLLGRRPVAIDEGLISAHVTGRRVLVTGAGGSIGAELCRQIHRFGPAELIMVDRDESALHAAQLSVYGRALLDGPDTVLLDIRDRATLHVLFRERSPQVVFHAAALKHLPLLERHPLEAWKTNVVGTVNLLSAAAASAVECFVNVSTDKAANPVSVLGCSKRVAERLTAGYAQAASGRYVSVRFGNVLGSRGSVLKTFELQIADGGPVTVTHPEATRFFMTIAEACQLVLQAAAIGRDGEALLLNMGTPVRIVDVARTLIARAGRPRVEIVFTGLRPGEKLHEELFGDGEPVGDCPRHPLVSHVSVPPLEALADGYTADRFDSDAAALAWLREHAVGLPIRVDA
jgi:FlaA1/EpsC-like NDP-sugar epimerase